VFVVVAPPHGVGTAPNRIAPPATSSTAEPPGVIDALTEAVAGLYVQDSAWARAGNARAKAAQKPPSKGRGQTRVKRRRANWDR
jgi:hypothetical protein